MAAKRCSPCDISFPYDKKVCESCGGELWHENGSSHDVDWRERVNKRTTTTVPEINIEVTNRDGLLFIASKELQDRGIGDIQTDSILYINGSYYEVQGAYMDGDSPNWWVEVVELEWDNEKHPVMTEFEYEQLEQKRGRR